MALMAGCAGPSAERATSRPTAFAGDLAGTWQGSFWWLGGYYYEDEGTVLLQIEEDGIFTVAMRPTGAANNVAKASARA